MSLFEFYAQGLRTMVAEQDEKIEDKESETKETE